MDEQRRDILELWRVSDARGRVLLSWLEPVKALQCTGRTATNALELVAVR